MERLYSITVPPAGDVLPAVLLLIPAILLLILTITLWHYRKLHRALRQLRDLCTVQDNHLHEIQTTLHTIARIGKISYCISDLQGAVQVPYRPANNTPGWETFLKNMAPDDQETIRKKLRKVFSGELNYFSENVSMQINNTWRQHTVSVNTFFLPGNGCRKLLFTAIDTSDIEEKARELADADSILKAIFDNLPGHIFLKNISSDFSYVRCNPAYSALVQMNPAEMIGKNDFDLFERDLAKAIRNCDMNIARTKSLEDNRWFFSTPDNKDHVIRFISRPLQKTDGTCWILGFGVDVTRQELIASKLRRRNKELRMLLAQLNIRAMLLDTHLHLACATPDLLQQLDLQDSGSQELDCRTLCRCGVEDKSLCAACHALQSKQQQTCTYAQFGSAAVTVKPLLSTDGTVNYLAVIPQREKQTDNDQTKDQT